MVTQTANKVISRHKRHDSHGDWLISKAFKPELCTEA